MLLRAILLLGLVAAGLTGCGARAARPTPTPGILGAPRVPITPSRHLPTVPTTGTITYTVTGLDGTTSAALTYANARGATEQALVPLPWTRTFDATPGQYVYLAAQSRSATGGVACTIAAGGTVARQEEARGPFVVVNCDGSRP